jgi:hypothetical protein
MAAHDTRDRRDGGITRRLVLRSDGLGPVLRHQRQRIAAIDRLHLCGIKAGHHHHHDAPHRIDTGNGTIALDVFEDGVPPR